MIEFNTNYSSKNYHKGVNKKQYIILHNTWNPANPPDINELKYMSNNDRVSIHYMIGKDGTIYQFANDDAIVWHAGDWNNKSIGIEVIWYLDFTDEQRQALKQLVTHLMQTHNITIDRVLRHTDIDPKRRSDLVQEFFHPHTRETWKDDLLTRHEMQQDNYAILIDELSQLWKDISDTVFTVYEWDNTLSEKQIKSLIALSHIRNNEKIMSMVENTIKHMTFITKAQ